MKYSGCIIDESIKDKSVINEFKIVEKIDDDGIMWLVEIDEDKINYILPKLQASMVDSPIWYCDLKCEDWHYIIFNDKIFRVNRDCPEQYEETRQYGLNRGIPDEQLPNKTWAKQ